MSAVAISHDRVTTTTDADLGVDPWLCRFVMIGVWVLPLMAFTMPQRVASDAWNLFDSVKLLILAYACFGGALVLGRNLSDRRLQRATGPLLPFYGFLGWAILTILWSPLKSVSTAQAGGLVAMLFLATAVAVMATRRESVVMILRHLNGMLLVCSGIAMVAYLVDPEMSGLDRMRIHHGGDGLIHPTAAGATASLGLLLPVLCHTIGRFSWAGKWLLPALVLHGSVLVVSNSRTAIVLAAVTIAVVLFQYSSNLRRAWAMFAFAMLCLITLLVDPGFEAISRTLGMGAQYVARGQTTDQLREVSGRSELWSAIWREYQQAMMLGHGYFVSSASGSIFVWNERHNYTAHNLTLQILVSTGAIGLLIFAYALLQPWLTMRSMRWVGPFQRRLVAMLTVATLWFVGWSLVGDAFMGPIRPESVLFFSLLGIGVGQATEVMSKHSAAAAATC